ELLEICFEDNEIDLNCVDDAKFRDEIDALKKGFIEDTEIRPVVKDFIFEITRTLLAQRDNGMMNLEEMIMEFDKYFDNSSISKKTVSEEIKVILGKSIVEYYKKDFFEDLSTRCNVYPRMARSPFVWEMTSGEKDALIVFALATMWKKDNLFTIRTSYISKLMDKLQFRYAEVSAGESAQKISEKEQIEALMRELSSMSSRIEEIVASDYDPSIEAGVCKNVAILQDKGLLGTEVLNEKQLKKYLKAEW
ncbi:MAG: hypothetical protein K6G84_01120, partial [Lachnospiraceae bacterium]|nr:hypothetical protein [Lachnospiraceae bacterium]